MKAMIFAAGLGTRLQPLTNTMPKALVPVAGKPLLQHTIEKMIAAGFDEIIINVHHFARQIIDFAAANKHFGIRIEFSDESNQLLNTGGAIKKASWFFNDGQPFLVHNADILSNANLAEFLCRHAMSPTRTATLMVSERETSRYLLFDNDNKLRGWINRQTGEVKSPFARFDPETCRRLAFSGIQVLSPSVFDRMEAFPDRFSIIDFYLSICDKELIEAFSPPSLSLLDVGTEDALAKAAQFVSRNSRLSYF